MSTTKARKGSMEMLMEASKIHSRPAAIHKVELWGMKKRAMEAKRAPTRK